MARVLKRGWQLYPRQKGNIGLEGTTGGLCQNSVPKKQKNLTKIKLNVKTEMMREQGTEESLIDSKLRVAIEVFVKIVHPPKKLWYYWFITLTVGYWYIDRLVYGLTREKEDGYKGRGRRTVEGMRMISS